MVKLSKESIYTVVLGFCAAIITTDDIRPEFRYKVVSLMNPVEVIYFKLHFISCN